MKKPYFTKQIRDEIIARIAYAKVTGEYNEWDYTEPKPYFDNRKADHVFLLLWQGPCHGQVVTIRSQFRPVMPVAYYDMKDGQYRTRDYIERKKEPQ